MKDECFLLEVENATKGGSGVRLIVKRKDGKSARCFTPFEPYFYLLPSIDFEKAKKECEKTVASNHGRQARVVKVDVAEKIFGREKKKFLKVFVDSPGSVPPVREALKPLGELFEHDIPFTRRWLVDHKVVPSAKIVVDHEKGVAKSVSPIKSDEMIPNVRMLSFDIETHNPSGMPVAGKDPVIMASWNLGGKSGVLTYKKIAKPFVQTTGSEKEMMEALACLLREKKVDVLAGYNSDEFDLPYLMERAALLKADFSLGRDKKKPFTKKVGLRKRTRVSGRVHFDVFNALSFLNVVGAFKFSRLTLGTVYQELFGKEKVDTKKLEIWRAWDAGGKELEHLAEYSLADAKACSELAEYLLPLEIQLSRVSGLTLFEASRATAGQMVESLLLRKSFERGEIVPNKPSFAAVEERTRNPIQGAFVKVPEPGVYENIAVFDFRSLYPSIITSHNIDPFSLNCACCKDAFVSPTGARFCKKINGIIPETLEHVLDERVAAKDKMKGAGEEEKRLLNARQMALKILANSFYGYLAYPRSRYYSRECGESTTAWARQYIHDTMAEAEKNGFKVIYGDTDSLLVLLGEKTEKDALEFRDKINKDLPGRMELELEDFYPRGIFVSKKHEKEKKGAKKKYALINKEGKIKIRGFELVRRDWSAIARKTQREVLEILLKKGSVADAEKLVAEKISLLREGKVRLNELAITTQLRKNAKNYEIVSPEVSAVRKAQAGGARIAEHAIIEYVITRKGKTISEKATLLDLVEEGDYDAEYYINNQLLPAVLKILGAMGVSEEDFKLKGKQQGLNGFM